MKEKLPDHTDEPALNASTGVMLTVKQVWFIAVGLVTAAVSGSTMLYSVKAQLEEMQRFFKTEAWTLRDANDLRNESALRNPSVNYPDPKLIHQSNRR